MAESTTATALRSKRVELERIISSYENAASAARRDLAHVNATLELFERDCGGHAYPSRLSISRMFKRGEIFALCKTMLAEAQNGLDTRELALAVTRVKRMDENDAVLRKAIGFRIVQAMLRQEMSGHVASDGKRKGVKVWRLSGIS